MLDSDLGGDVCTILPRDSYYKHKGLDQNIYKFLGR